MQGTKENSLSNTKRLNKSADILKPPIKKRCFLSS